jgi:hypothetical protein
MKGKVSLSEFIESVKTELFDAAQKGSESPFFSLEEVELETEFSIEAEGKAGFKFFVDLEGKARGTQAHRVKLRLRPIPPSDIMPSEGKVRWFEDLEGEKKLIVENTDEIDPNKGPV